MSPCQTGAHEHQNLSVFKFNAGIFPAFAFRRFNALAVAPGLTVIVRDNTIAEPSFPVLREGYGLTEALSISRLLSPVYFPEGLSCFGLIQVFPSSAEVLIMIRQSLDSVFFCR